MRNISLGPQATGRYHRGWRREPTSPAHPPRSAGAGLRRVRPWRLSFCPLAAKTAAPRGAPCEGNRLNVNLCSRGGVRRDWAGRSAFRGNRVGAAAPAAGGLEGSRRLCRMEGRRPPPVCGRNPFRLRTISLIGRCHLRRRLGRKHELRGEAKRAGRLRNGNGGVRRSERSLRPGGTLRREYAFDTGRSPRFRLLHPPRAERLPPGRAGTEDVEAALGRRSAENSGPFGPGHLN